MANPFDQFDTIQSQPMITGGSNPFDQFDSIELKSSHTPVKSDTSLSQGQSPGDFAGMLMEENKDNPLMDPQVRSNLYRPILEGGGAMVGTVAGAPTGPGALATGAVGFATGKGIADTMDILSGVKEPYRGSEAFKQTAKDIGTGAMYEVAGQAAGPALSMGAKAVGKVVKPVLGRMSGVGSSAISEAIKSSPSFKNALRGKITGDEIVDNAKSALSSLKDQRAAAYQSQLATIAQSGKAVDTKPLINDLTSLMKKYNVRVDAAGKLDTSRIAMGKTGRNDIAEIVETISKWGSKPGDTTAEGLDVLKRQLDDFYSDSSQARQFVSSIRNSVKKVISDAVPEYEKMTKGYSEATKLIKDIESGLMMRKQGISGRIVADQTLRRLMSSMKDNFTLRKELVDILGSKSGKDLSGQIAGFTMKTPLPVGLAGTGPALAAEAAYSMVNPSFWPVLAASSPRVQAEFLMMFGKVMGVATKIDPLILKEGIKQILINKEFVGKSSGTLPSSATPGGLTNKKGE